MARRRIDPSAVICRVVLLPRPHGFHAHYSIRQPQPRESGNRRTSSTPCRHINTPAMTRTNVRPGFRTLGGGSPIRGKARTWAIVMERPTSSRPPTTNSAAPSKKRASPIDLRHGRPSNSTDRPVSTPRPSAIARAHSRYDFQVEGIASLGLSWHSAWSSGVRRLLPCRRRAVRAQARSFRTCSEVSTRAKMGMILVNDHSWRSLWTFQQQSLTTTTS